VLAGDHSAGPAASKSSAHRVDGPVAPPGNDYEAFGLEWPSRGRVRLLHFTEPRPAAEQVTVQVTSSVVSPGTERARYLGLPNAEVTYPHRPGYAAAGTVVAVGENVGDLAPGQAVALLDVPHQSLVTLPRERAHLVPPGVDPQHAAILQIALIAAHGVRQAALRKGEEFTVIGAGLVGALAHRFAAADNAGPCTVVAATRAKQELARRGGASRFLTTAEDLEVIECLDAPTVIDASGDPATFALAVRAAAPEGRVVLLGSPRGRSDDLCADLIVRKRLRVVGAHVNGLKNGVAGSNGAVPPAVLAALACGAVEVGDLLGLTVDPREAELFYRRLAADRSIAGARFDWAGFHTPAARPPSQLRRRARHPRLSIDPGNPFAGAKGHVRFGVIGCGEIAVHNALALAEAPNTSLTTCHDIQLPLAEDLAARFGAKAVRSIGRLLESSDVDAVLLCLPHHLHAPVAAEAAWAGKHVVVEKPLASDLAGAVRMVKAARQAGVALSVCFPQRYQAASLVAREYLREGLVGTPSALDGRWFTDKPPAYFYGGFTGRSRSPWRKYADQAGGGVLLMNLSHDLDLVRHLTGMEVEAVSAVTANLDGLGEVEDLVSLTVRYQSGAVGSFLASAAARGLHQESLRVLGTSGHVEVKPRLKVFTLKASNDPPTGRWQTPLLPRLPDRAIYFSRFATAIACGGEADVTGADGVAVQACIEAAYRSARIGCAINPAELLKELDG
jgi:predicted dehydrogenase/threonine dehydrogenase-like Zn-dependent dehydrogenase